MVSDQTGIRKSPVPSFCESVQYGLFAGLIQLECHSHTGTADVGRAIEVALRIPEQSCVRIGAIGFSGKAVQRLLLAVLVHLVDRSVTGGPAPEDGSVEVPRGIADQT